MMNPELDIEPAESEQTVAGFLRHFVKENPNCTGCGVNIQLHSSKRKGFISSDRLYKNIKRNNRVSVHSPDDWVNRDQDVLRMLKEEVRAPKQVLDSFSQ